MNRRGESVCARFHRVIKSQKDFVTVAASRARVSQGHPRRARSPRPRARDMFLSLART